jgi:hypothetical protein
LNLIVVPHPKIQMEGWILSFGGNAIKKKFINKMDLEFQ